MQLEEKIGISPSVTGLVTVSVDPGSRDKPPQIVLPEFAAHRWHLRRGFAVGSGRNPIQRSRAVPGGSDPDRCVAPARHKPAATSQTRSQARREVTGTGD